MQSDRKHVPHPTVNTKLSSRFYLQIDSDIAYESGFMVSRVPYLSSPFRFHHLLENGKLLLVLVDRDKFSIYLSRPAAILNHHPLKTLNRDKLGLGRDSNVLLAFDEAKRILAVFSSAKVVRRSNHLSASDLRLLISYSFTHSYSMKPTRRFKGREVLSISLRGTARQIYQLFKCRSCVETMRWRW